MRHLVQEDLVRQVGAQRRENGVAAPLVVVDFESLPSDIAAAPPARLGHDCGRQRSATRGLAPRRLAIVEVQPVESICELPGALLSETRIREPTGRQQKVDERPGEAREPHGHPAERRVVDFVASGPLDEEDPATLRQLLGEEVVVLSVVWSALPSTHSRARRRRLVSQRVALALSTGLRPCRSQLAPCHSLGLALRRGSVRALP